MGQLAELVGVARRTMHAEGNYRKAREKRAKVNKRLITTKSAAIIRMWNVATHQYFPCPYMAMHCTTPTM